MTNPVFLADEKATHSFATMFSGCLKEFGLPESGFTIYLDGDLGAGKTTFTRALLHALGFSGHVKSPTYTLLEEYHLSCGIVIQHFDLYRFSSSQEWEDAGFDDCVCTPALRLIEWAEKGDDYPPPADCVIAFCVQDVGRMVTITALSDLGKDLFSQWHISLGEN